MFALGSGVREQEFGNRSSGVQEFRSCRSCRSSGVAGVAGVQECRSAGVQEYRSSESRK
jgi:hypothetical protein